jgi:hypothetical protein
MIFVLWERYKLPNFLTRVCYRVMVRKSDGRADVTARWESGPGPVRYEDGRSEVTCAFPDRRPRLEQSSIRSNLQRSQAKRSQTPKLGRFPGYRS